MFGKELLALFRLPHFFRQLSKYPDHGVKALINVSKLPIDAGAEIIVDLCVAACAMKKLLLLAALGFVLAAGAASRAPQRGAHDPVRRATL